ncbi:MAG: Cys-Gln thioester bond-forming surface protein, partial [Ruminococcus sp.]|nr:Cys-Gln thioester bond-forming surface protein [Ruminococcus sp.]
MIKIRNILKKCAALACAAAIGVTTLATSASAAVSGVTIKYEWNSSVNPTLYTRKNAVSGGVSGQYLRYGEQICRFSPSSSNGYAFCIEPAKQMLGYQYGNWYTQYGFTKYDTFNLTDKNTADTTAYWKSLGGTSGYYSKYMGLVEYYGYGSHKTGDYYAATQILIWEMILGYRGHTPSTFSKCTDVLWNDFTYPANCYCTKSGVEKAYNEIVANVNGHYNLPSGTIKQYQADAVNHPAILLKYDTNKMRYQGSCTVPNVYLNANSLTHNFSTTEAKLVEMAKARFTGTYGKDYGVEKTTNGTNTVFTLWSTNRPFTSSSASTIYTTAPIQMQIKSGISQFETLFANSYYQTCLLSTKLDPVSGYIGMASYNEPNMIVEKTYTDSHNRALTAQTLSSMLDKTSFVISTNLNGKTYYVQAAKTSDGTAYSFTKYVGSAADATKFVTLKKSNTNGFFTVYDLPTSASSGRTYTVTEYTVPDNERYEKLSKSVTLPSPTSGALTQDPGTKTVKMNNTERGYNAQFGDASLDKTVLNGDGKALSSDKESDISKLSGIYKSTKFIVGYWDGNTVRYLSDAYMSAKNAFDGDLKDLDDFNDVTYIEGDGMYYVPTTLDKDHRLVFDSAKTTTDMSKAYVFGTGYNYSGKETCAHFGEIYLNLLPLNADKTVKEVFFIEVNGAKGYGYSQSLDTANAVSLKVLGSVTNKRSVTGLVKNDTGKNITVYDVSRKYVIAANRYYPISSASLGGNKMHEDATIINQLTTYGLRLVKKNGKGEVIQGAKYGLYNASKALLKTGTTNANGEIKFEYDLVPNTDYYVHEISAPQGYVLDKAYYKVNKTNTVVNDTDTFSNAKLPEEKITTIEKEFELRIELDKYDVINNISVEGIEFDVSLNGKSVGTMKTDKNGHAVIEHLPLGKLNGYSFENVYELTELKNSSYILLDDDGNAVRKIRIETTVADIKDETNPVITYTCDVPNTLQTVDLTVHKVDEFRNTIKGAKFEIYPTKDVVFNGKTVQSAGKVLGTLETDKDGKASTSYMEYAETGSHGYEMKIPVYPGHEYALREIYVPEP